MMADSSAASALDTATAFHQSVTRRIGREITAVATILTSSALVLAAPWVLT